MRATMLLLWFLFVVCDCSLTIYPHPNGLRRSTKFNVHLSQTGHPRQSTFVYMATSDSRAFEESYVHPNRSVSWTSFAFTGSPVTAEISTSHDFQTCIVRPKHYGFQCRRTASKTAEVDFTQNTRMVSVEFDYDYGTSGHSDIVDKLLIFADAPETDVPSNHGDPHLLYYGPGVHDLGGQKLIESHITEVYLAPGAYIHGAFNTTRNHPGVHIHGRGVLSGERYAFLDPRILWSLILLDAGSQHRVEGVVLVDPTKYYLRALSRNNTVRNIKTLAAWTYNSDGVALGPNGTVEDCFITANDDALKVYGDSLKASRIVIWQSHNGAVFQFGWWAKRILHHVTVSDIDVIHTDWCAFKGNHCYISRNSAVFDLAEGTKTFDIDDMEFRNIRIEGVCPRIFNFQVPHDATGVINNVRLINWSVEKASPYSNLHNDISGTTAIPLTNWQMVNLQVASHCVGRPSDADIRSDHSTVHLSFHCGSGQIVG